MDELASGESALIQIILADSQAIYQIGTLKLLTSETDMRVVAQTNTLEGLRRAAERFLIQSTTQRAPKSPIILLAGNMVSGTVDAIPDLNLQFPQSKIIAQLDEKDESHTIELYRRGVSGIILRSIPPDLLVKCVRKTAAGEIWIDNQTVNKLIEAYRSPATAAAKGTQPCLSPKELAIITCITEGKRNKEIAHQLGTTEQVIKNYLRRVYDKVGVSDRIELALYGLHHKLHKRGSESRSQPIASASVPHMQGKRASLTGFARFK